MANKIDSSIDIGWFLLLMTALGIIEAYVIGVPWYVGGALGAVLCVISIFGIVPVLGQLAYMGIAKWLFAEVGAGMMSWIYWLGFFASIIVSFFVIVAILADRW